MRVYVVTSERFNMGCCDDHPGYTERGVEVVYVTSHQADAYVRRHKGHGTTYDVHEVEVYGEGEGGKE